MCEFLSYKICIYTLSEFGNIVTILLPGDEHNLIWSNNHQGTRKVDVNLVLGDVDILHKLEEVTVKKVNLKNVFFNVKKLKQTFGMQLISKFLVLLFLTSANVQSIQYVQNLRYNYEYNIL